MQDRKLCFNDILLVPQYSELDSRTTPNISTCLGGKLKLGIPIISSPMDSVTGAEMAVTLDRLGGLGIISRNIGLSEDEEIKKQTSEIIHAKHQNTKNIGCAMGIKGDINWNAQKLLDVGCNVLCLDVAHGDHKMMYKAIDILVDIKCSDTYDFIIMAGNVCTRDAATKFAMHGVDAIKVGIGPGAACTTRIITGHGYPQLSAILETHQAIKTTNRSTSIIVDGGLRTGGDMVKSLFAGADACMIGYMLAGTNCTPLIDGKRVYRGMSSRNASGRPDIAPEGIEIETGYKGETENVILNSAKEIKSGLAMSGAHNIKELREKGQYVMVSSLSMEETMPRKT